MTDEKTRKSGDKDDLKDQIELEPLTDEETQKATGAQIAPTKPGRQPLSFDDPGPPAVD